MTQHRRRRRNPSSILSVAIAPYPRRTALLEWAERRNAVVIVSSRSWRTLRDRSVAARCIPRVRHRTRRCCKVRSPGHARKIALVVDDPRTAQLEILNEVARIATLDLELRPMLQRITDALASKFEWEFVALVTIDPERDVFVCEALTSAITTTIDVGYTRALGSGVVGQVAATGEPQLIDDVRTYSNYIETLPGAQSELCVPVRHHDRIVAVLNLESTRPAAFHGQLPLLTVVADQIAGAIASGQLYAELKKVTTQLEQKTSALEEANTHLGKAIETLHRISTQDGLTQVANRRHFDDTLALEWRRAARNGMPLSLLILDIDFFKPFNDEHGHQAGDDVLRQVAQVLRESVHRAADLVARYGGEEFVVLLPETDADHAREIAESLRQSIEVLGTITASVGAATQIASRDGNAEALVRRADEALYEAKRLGRNRVVVDGSLVNPES